MKKIINTLAIALALVACNTVELDQPILGPVNSDNNGNNNQPQIQAGDIQANDMDEAIAMIADSTTRLWRAAEFTLAGSSAMTGCRLDDMMTFNVNGTYEYNTGRTLCGAEDNRRVRQGTWSVNIDDQEVTFDEGTSSEYTAQILELNDSVMSLRGIYLNLEVRGRYTAN